ncbi:hypothetical protein CWB96_17815 [Pseudoalteromonas citrea]|uniref:Uncharacterized protein n=1 Tax=Pseudoalteromonas citrea TaxID=43655 RepID=A0A5S3XKC6_9GAMM|nr:hypothetical protein CWB97_12165 [Pseudoalteromonas citrea]TMP55147.1 hypothetical protein CWB96_17815 [Pseudoalteromonas citrea]
MVWFRWALTFVRETKVGLFGLGAVICMGPDLRQGDEVGLLGLGAVTYMGPDLRQGDEVGLLGLGGLV